MVDWAKYSEMGTIVLTAFEASRAIGVNTLESNCRAGIPPYLFYNCNERLDSGITFTARMVKKLEEGPWFSFVQEVNRAG